MEVSEVMQARQVVRKFKVSAGKDSTLADVLSHPDIPKQGDKHPDKGLGRLTVTRVSAYQLPSRPAFTGKWSVIAYYD